LRKRYNTMQNITDYNTKKAPDWCAGCGNFLVRNSILQALIDLKKKPHEVVMTYDVGCAGNMADKIKTYGFKSLHGRTVPVAIGAKLANPELTVIATGGDGGIFEEGVNHLMWAARSNYDITVVMHNNNRFALTTGQPTTTTDEGQPGKTAPWGIVENDINPARLALVSNASFVARGFAPDTKQVTSLIKAAVRHKGFAFVEVLQHCVTLNKVNTIEWFKERIYNIENKKGYDPSDWDKAFKESACCDKIATGLIYKAKRSVPYLSRLPYRKGMKTNLVDEVKEYQVKEMLNEFE